MEVQVFKPSRLGASVAGVVVAACEVRGGSDGGENRPRKFGKTATKTPPVYCRESSPILGGVAKLLVMSLLGGGRYRTRTCDLVRVKHAL